MSAMKTGEHWPLLIEETGFVGQYCVGSREHYAVTYGVRLQNTFDECTCRGWARMRRYGSGGACVHITACRAKGLPERYEAPQPAPVYTGPHPRLY